MSKEVRSKELVMFQIDLNISKALLVKLVAINLQINQP